MKNENNNNVRDGEYRYLNRDVEAPQWDSMPETMDVHRFIHKRRARIPPPGDTAVRGSSIYGTSHSD